MDGDHPTEERPIVTVEPKNDDDATEIVAPNLREFLGLVSVAFAEVVSRGASDADWSGFRNKWYGDDATRLVRMAHLSDLLRTIPGVVEPQNPSQVANAYPDQAFQLVFDDEEANTVLPVPNRLSEAREAATFAQRALDEHRYEEAAQHARYGLRHPASAPRSLFILAQAQWHMGRKNAARTTAEGLLRGWLDPSIVTPPAVHPRRAIDGGELISLIRLVEGARAQAWIASVESASEIEVPDGDFL